MTAFKENDSELGFNITLSYPETVTKFTHTGVAAISLGIEIWHEARVC